MIDHAKTDHAEANYQTALKVLTDVGGGLRGAPPETGKLWQITQRGITAARNAIYGAQLDIDRLLNDNDLYPQGRYERVSAIFDKTSELVKEQLNLAQVAARTMGPALDAAALPRFEGSDQEQQFIRDEIRDIVNRSNDPAEELARLARDPRYAGLAASHFGRSLLLGRGLDDRAVERSYELVKSEAFGWAMEHGTPEQRAAAARVSLGETIKAAPLAAESAFQMWLEDMRGKVRAAGLKAMQQEPRQNARRTR